MEMLPNVLIMSKDDLFSQSQDSEDWKMVREVTEIKVFKDFNLFKRFLIQERIL